MPSPGGVQLGHPNIPTFVRADSVALAGATNLVLDHVDHREVAYSPRAFAEIYSFIVGRTPSRIAIVPEGNITLSGVVTAVIGETPTNRPVAGANVKIFAVDPETGERKGQSLLTMTTGADGNWGPLNTDSATALEFVVAVPGSPITHIYRSPFPRLVCPPRSQAGAREFGSRHWRRNRHDPAARLFRLAARRHPARRSPTTRRSLWSSSDLDDEP